MDSAAIELHYNDVNMGAIAPKITSLTIVFSTVYLDTDQRKHQSSASLAFVRGIHRRPVKSPHKCPVTRKMFPFDDVIMRYLQTQATPPAASCPARSLNATEIVSKHNHNNMPEAALDNYQPVWNAQVSISTPYVLIWNCALGPDSIKRYHLTSIGNPIVEIRRS